MTSMFKFLKKKIRPFKKCTANPSYSFEAVDNDHQSKTPQVKPSSTQLHNTYHEAKKERKRFFQFNKRRTNKKGSISSSDMMIMSTNNSLQNREATNSIVDEEQEEEFDCGNGIDTIEDRPSFETPSASMNSNFIDRCSYGGRGGGGLGGSEWESQSYSDDLMYSDEDCIQDLIDHTNQVTSPGQNSMVTYNTHKFADTSQLSHDEDGLRKSASTQSLQQTTPFDEIEYGSFDHNNKRHSTVLSEMDEFSNFKKSKTFQNHNQLVANNNGQKRAQQMDSPVYKKLDLKQNRKCRRSNTTFTMAGMRKNKIIEYFNNLELNKPISKAVSKPKLFSSNREIAQYRPIHHQTTKPDNQIDPQSQIINDSKTSSTDSSLSQSKTENEKIQDLFFYDESILSNRHNNNESHMTTDANLTVDSVSVNVLQCTFLDSPVSDKSLTPVFCKVTSTNNSVERFRRSNSMPGVNDGPDFASMGANNSKIDAIKVLDDSNMHIITPKKVLNFDNLIDNHNSNNTITTPGTPLSHYISSFEDCDDEASTAQSTFVRGQTRNLSKNIKQMFKNVIKLQLDALASLEKFYEAQLLKVETDRQKNLEANPMNRKKINEFFDKQLEMLEERVQVNLENITKEKQQKQGKTTSSSSLKFNNQASESSSDDSCVVTKKKEFTQKLAQIISSNNNQNCASNNNNYKSKNLIELKNNLISQKTMLPSKMGNQSVGVDGSSSPRNGSTVGGFKRNLSLPFKQCRQNYQRVRNESVHEAVHFSRKVNSAARNVVEPVENNNELVDFGSYNKNPVKAHEITQRCMVTNNLAKIVKLNTTNDKRHNFAHSLHSAFKPYNNRSQLVANNCEAYEEISDEINNLNFVPSELDIRRNSSVFYKQDMSSDMSLRQNIPLPRLSDSHLLFRIKQEKRMNDKKIVSTYQKQFQSKLIRQVPNFGHVETEV